MPLRRLPKPPPIAGAGNGGRSSLPIDWAGFLRRVERKRRLLDRPQRRQSDAPPPGYYERATYSSFRLEGLEVTEQEVREALAHGVRRSVLRSRQSQRMRNHAAILRHIESDLREGTPLETGGGVRWYTGISAGLSTTDLDQATAVRLGDVVRRINSPQMRIRPALLEIAVAHAQLLADPLVPGFNGILARLLLRYHLGRCKLPAVVFDPMLDDRPWTAEALAGRLVQLLEESYEGLLGRGK